MPTDNDKMPCWNPDCEDGAVPVVVRTPDHALDLCEVGRESWTDGPCPVCDGEGEVPRYDVRMFEAFGDPCGFSSVVDHEMRKFNEKWGSDVPF